MKKIVIGMLLALACVGVMAQTSAGSWYIAVLPGWQWNTQNYNETGNLFGSAYKLQYKGQGNFTGSIDAGYMFTDSVGLHFAYVYNDGKFDVRYYNYTYGVAENFNLRAQQNIFEIGPEFAHTWNACHQIYGQLNVGYTFGGNTTYYYYGGHRYDLGNLGDNDWTWGGAFGYRFWFNDTAAFATQLAYHHMSNSLVSDIWDARIGVAFKF